MDLYERLDSLSDRPKPRAVSEAKQFYVPINTKQIDAMKRDVRDAFKKLVWPAFIEDKYGITQATKATIKGVDKTLKAFEYVRRIQQGLYHTFAYELVLLPKKITTEEALAAFLFDVVGVGYGALTRGAAERIAKKLGNQLYTDLQNMDTTLDTVENKVDILKDVSAALKMGVESPDVKRQTKSTIDHFLSGIGGDHIVNWAIERKLPPDIPHPSPQWDKRIDWVKQNPKVMKWLTATLRQMFVNKTLEDLGSQYYEREFDGWVKIALSHMLGVLDSLKDAVRKSLPKSKKARDTISQMAKDPKAYDLDKVPLKRGEMVVRAFQIPREGLLGGFKVYNTVGLRLASWDDFGQVMTVVSQLLKRKGFGFLSKTPVYIKQRPGRKVKVKATGDELQIGAVYNISTGHVEFYVDGQRGRFDHNFAVEIMVHELGHRYYYKEMPRKAQKQYNWYFRKAVSYPSSYAQNAPEEDFAEIFTSYVGRGYRRVGSGYRIDKDIFQRFRSALNMDPKVKKLDVRAESVDTTST
jgi:hypothetical protein